MDAQPLNMRAGKSIKSAACSCATRSFFAIFHIRTNTKHWNLLLKIEFSLHASNYADQNVSLMPELFIYICSTLLYILYLYLLCKVIFGQRLNFCVIGLSDVWRGLRDVRTYTGRIPHASPRQVIMVIRLTQRLARRVDIAFKTHAAHDFREVRGSQEWCNVGRNKYGCGSWNGLFLDNIIWYFYITIHRLIVSQKYIYKLRSINYLLFANLQKWPDLVDAALFAGADTAIAHRFPGHLRQRPEEGGAEGC